MSRLWLVPMAKRKSHGARGAAVIFFWRCDTELSRATHFLASARVRCLMYGLFCRLVKQ